MDDLRRFDEYFLKMYYFATSVFNKLKSGHIVFYFLKIHS